MSIWAMGKGFYPLNTAADATDTRKCVRLFQDWNVERNVWQGSWWYLGYPKYEYPKPIPLLVQIYTEIHNVVGSHYSPHSAYMPTFQKLTIRTFWSFVRTINCALFCYMYLTFASVDCVHIFVLVLSSDNEMLEVFMCTWLLQCR